MMSVENFQITTPESDLIDLKERLSRTRWPNEIASSGWSQGTNAHADINGPWQTHLRAA